MQADRRTDGPLSDWEGIRRECRTPVSVRVPLLHVIETALLLCFVIGLSCSDPGKRLSLL